MVRYPIFVFDRRGRPDVFEDEGDFWSGWCCPDCASGLPDDVFDSDGRILFLKEDEEEYGLVDSGVEPEPDRLRQMLFASLYRRGYRWAEDTPLENLVAEVRKKPFPWDSNAAIARGFANISQFIRRKVSGRKSTKGDQP